MVGFNCPWVCGFGFKSFGNEEPCRLAAGCAGVALAAEDGAVGPVVVALCVLLLAAAGAAVFCALAAGLAAAGFAAAA